MKSGDNVFVEPGDGVLHGVGERVAQVKLPRHVGRRNDHHEHVVLRMLLQRVPSQQKQNFTEGKLIDGEGLSIRSK